MARLRIGELLVSAKFITQAQLDQALELPRKEGQRLGDLLVEQAMVTETQLTQLLGQQLSVPWVSLSHIEFSRQLLNLVPRDVAEKYGLVPIYVRRVRKQGDTLYVAMNDPTNDAALAEASKFAGLPVRPMIAGQSDIRNAIRVYYGGDAEVAPATQVQSAPATVAARPAAARPATLPQKAMKQPVPAQSGVSLPPDELIEDGSERPPPDTVHDRPDPNESTLMSEGMAPLAKPTLVVVSESGDSPDAAPEIEATEISIPRPKREGSTGLSGLTLLDGTTIQFPKRPVRKKKDALEALAGVAEELSTKEIIDALRAATQGKDAGAEDEAKWTPIFTAILALLARKGFVADREFVEELRKL
ncbi:MAG: hypothetical protein ABIP39_15595 [Polyangiaceae bacterium]